MGIVNITVFMFLLLFANTDVKASQLAGHGESNKPLKQVQDLRYGVALYHYYLDQHLQALTELQIANKQGGIQGHGNNPLIMTGGIYLGYGLDNISKQIFQSVLTEEHTQKVKDAAWYFLAKQGLLDGSIERADYYLAKVSQSPPGSFSEEVRVFSINLLIQKSMLDEAASLLNEFKGENGWLPYLYFNMGSAYCRVERYAEGVAYFDKIKPSRKMTEETLGVYDKAMTAAGFASIFMGNNEQAIEYFTKVRLQSGLSDKALLGYGLASSNIGDNQSALRSWSYLSKKSYLDANTTEALVAVPYAYEKMEMYGKALTSLHFAKDRITKNIDDLWQTIDSMRQENIVETLELSSYDSARNLNYINDKKISPKSHLLTNLYAEKDFHQDVQSLYDLLVIKQTLERWQVKLDFYSENVNNRIRFRSHLQQDIEAGVSDSQLKQFKVQQNRLQSQINTIENESDYYTLASNAEKGLIKRVKRSLVTVERIKGSNPLHADYAEALRRYTGLLIWQAADQFAQRLWLAKKEANQIGKVLQRAQKTHQNINEILNRSIDLNSKLLQIERSKIRTAEQIQRVELEILDSKQQISKKAIAHLKRQDKQLKGYLAHTRLAIARVNDTLSDSAWGAEEMLESTEELTDEGDTMETSRVIKDEITTEVAQ